MAAAKRLVFTLDLEDHRPDESYPRRYPEITGQILDFLDERRIEATVFVLGRLARETPELIKAIARRGHEIAFHSHAHVHLTQEDPGRFRRETADGKHFLEDLIGRSVVGYRAPAFSLTRNSLWAVEAIAELGFRYSSSLLPANNPIFGFPGAPRRPFLWPNELLEIPAPVARLGPLTLPFLGGFYLRYLPLALIRDFLRRGDDEQCYWAYCHPHDFDYEERFYRIAGTSYLTSALLWFNRKNTFKKLERLIPALPDTVTMRSFESLIEAGVFADAPVFDLSLSETRRS